MQDTYRIDDDLDRVSTAVDPMFSVRDVVQELYRTIQITLSRSSKNDADPNVDVVRCCATSAFFFFSGRT